MRLARRLNYFPPFRVGVSLSMETVLLPLETLQSAIATTGVIPFTLPPSCRFPPLREGNRAARSFGSPAHRGNLKEGVFNLTCNQPLAGD